MKSTGKRHLFKTAAFVFMLLTLVASLLGLRSEYRLTAAFSSNKFEDFQQLEAELAAPEPASQRSTRQILIRCSSLPLDPVFSLQPAETNRKQGDVCLTLARNVLRIAPTNGPALLVLATFAADDVEAQNAAKQSWHANAVDAWAIQTRAALFARNPDWSAETYEEIAQADALIALQEDWGQDWLAKIYATDPSARDRIAKAVERAAPQNQAAFLEKAAIYGRG